MRAASFKAPSNRREREREEIQREPQDVESHENTYPGDSIPIGSFSYKFQLA